MLSISRLVPRKGVDDVIAALQWLPEAELIVAGGPDAAHVSSDSEAVRLTQLATHHGVADRVRLMGQVPHTELPMLIRSADLVVCLPWYEPFGIVPLEAMACGVPVVGTAVGGLLDTIIDGETGVLVPARHPRYAAYVMRELLAQMLNDIQPVAHPTWGFVIDHWPGAVEQLLRADGGFVRDGAWYSAAFLLAGVLALFLFTRGARGGAGATLLKAATVAAVAYILVVPVFSAFRRSCRSSVRTATDPSSRTSIIGG